MINTQRRDDEIDLKNIFNALLKKIWLILLVSILFTMISVVYSKIFVTPTFKSTAQMYVLTKQNQEVNASDFQVSTLLTQDYMQIIKSRTVAETVIARLNLDATYESLNGQMSVQTATETRIISISVIDENPYQARDIADAVREVSAEQIKKVMDTEAVNVVDKANIPSRKYAPNITKCGIIAGMIGFCLTSLLIILECVLNDTIKTTEDIKRYLELNTLGVVPLSSKKKKVKKKLIKKLLNMIQR